MNGQRFDVFLCHNSKDKPAVRRLGEALKKRRLSVWLDEWALVPGRPWQEALEEIVLTVKTVAVLVGSDGLGPWQDREMRSCLSEFVARGLPVIPILLPGASSKPDVPLILKQFTWVDLRDGLRSEGLDRIEWGIRGTKKDTSDQRDSDFPDSSEQRSDADEHVGSDVHGHGFTGCLVALCVTAIVVLGAMFIRLPGLPSPGPDYVENCESFFGGLPNLKWVVYDPTGYDPFDDKFPSEQSIREDLRELHQVGFDGLITMNCRKTLGSIPRLAHQMGFNQVVAGVFDLRNEGEIQAAIDAARHVDAYCLGHNGFPGAYTFGEVEKRMAQFRHETSRPVTTTMPIADYLEHPRVCSIVDFLMPDVHALWHNGKTPKEAWRETLAYAQQAGTLGHKSNHLVLLKMVSYPSSGEPNFTEDAQREFYGYAVEEVIERVDVPRTVNFAFMGAFDTPWKTATHGFKQGDQHTGLFTTERRPKPVVNEINWEFHF